MNKIFALIKREYKDSVYKKSFIVMTLLTPLIMVALGVVPSLLMQLDTGKQVKLNIIDQSGFVAGPLQAALTDTLPNGQNKFLLTLLPPGANRDEQKALIREETINGLIIIPANVADSGKVEFYSKNVADFGLNRSIRSAIQKIVIDHRIVKSGLNPELVGSLTKSLELTTIKISKEGTESKRGFTDEYFSTFIFVLILYMSLIMYGTSIMRSIVQEKNSRIIEVLLASANPFQLMAGKIFGQGSVGITQYLIWALFGIGMIFYGGNVLPISAKYFNFAPSLFIYFVVFFVLGYLVYAIMYSAIGAISNSDQEAQQMSMPVILMLIVPIMMLGYLVKAPDSTLSVTLSLIPFFSPIIMFARINLSNPPLIEVLGSIGILIVTILFLVWFVAKIYRVGILMYGKRPTLPEIVKWMRYK